MALRNQTQSRPPRDSPNMDGDTREQTMPSVLGGPGQESVQSAVGPGHATRETAQARRRAKLQR